MKFSLLLPFREFFGSRITVAALLIAAPGSVLAADDDAHIQPAELAALLAPALPPQNWNLHWQSTFVEQADPGLRSPYQGRNSLSGAAQGKETWSTTAFLGVKLWEGAELYYNPELDEGFGLSDTVGVAGFPNGEAMKGGFNYLHYNTTRAFLRQTFGLGGEQEAVEDGQNQLAGKRDVSRVTITTGKMAASDIFDDNAYAHDPRTGFLNWAIWEAGAFDYPADQMGFTWGTVAELNQKDWALRAGYFAEPRKSNVNSFDMALIQRGGYVLEAEDRYTLFNQPGKLRLIGWINSVNAGSFSETLANPAYNVDIATTREGRVKYGFVVNFEQAASKDFGLFSRLSWNDGKTETMSFTDVNASVSFGGVLKGTSWERPDDRIGVAGAINALSPQAKAYLAAGGLEMMIGDGKLNYSEEKIFETYYAVSVAKQATLTLDYQFIADPAYNADRGPVSVYTARFHAEF